MGNLKQNLNQNNTRMKLSLIIAGLALSTAAKKFNPKRTPESMRGLNEDRFEVVDGKKVGTDALNYGALEDAGEATVYCLRESRAFDKYCHQYNAKEGKAVRYADFTVDGDCTSWEDEDGEPTTESVYCLAQDCMFDYCLWRRDEQLATCEAFVADWEAAVAAATTAADGEDQCQKIKFGVCVSTKEAITVGDYTGRNIRFAQRKNGFKRPGWGNVYNYNNMHDDLDTNDATDGEFVSAVCTEYYDDLDTLGDTY